MGTQFLGAFNDNLFKQLLLFLAAGYLFPGEDLQGLAFAIFALPFVLFSGMAGDLSERFSKRTVIVWMKVAEILVMALGAVALQRLQWPFMLAVLFLMGLQSAFFGPSKYGVIPELVSANRLLRANGLIAMTTFLGVLLGQALAGPLLDGFGGRLWVPGAACVFFAVVGTLFARFMAPLPPQNPQLRIGPSPFGSLWQTIGMLRRRKGLFRFVLLYSLFWFNGSVIQQAIVGMGEVGYLEIAKGEKRLLSYVLVTLALAIIVGSLGAPRLSRRMAAGRMAVLGAVVMVIGQLSLLLVGPVLDRAHGALFLTHLLMALIGLSGALFVVPVQSYLQHAPQPGTKGQTFAVNNFMNFLFMFMGGVYYLLVRRPALGVGPTAAQALSGVLVLAFLWLNRERVRSINIGEAMHS